ncbi:hypothetical protein KBX50_04980 [Micromonospora sp. C51]|uniref:hypothetical protein n=1 Tax=Micromonospora sp. C51 TaxID=2824879 RepID=UPI001B37530F|nr:hypothetical protein [Micromonospora sp. C51]MBQ1047821.1 hypothetical protein [Micromonospora sp. C51]
MGMYLDHATNLVRAAFNAATSDTVARGVNDEPWRNAYRRANLTWMDAAGLIAAHTTRLAADHAEQHHDEVPPWTHEVATSAPAISADPGDGRDQRAATAMAIRRALSRGRPGDPESEAPRLLSLWLFPPGPHDVAAGHLARHIITRADRYQRWWAAAWYAVHGLELVDVLTDRQPAPAPTGGRPRREVTDERESLRVAIRGVASARIVPKTRLAALAGISRPTLDTWLN